jgi:ribonuclease BN (tRNA processing enzyme)
MFDKGITALEPTNLTVAFATHLHSDHTVGYPDLIFTPWVMGRKVPLEVYGPKGIKAMTAHVLAAWQADIEERVSTETWQPSNYRDTYKVNVHEINAGVVYKDANVTVTAFPTKHAFPETYGYRFDTADRSVVISGTRPIRSPPSMHVTVVTFSFTRRPHKNSLRSARISSPIRRSITPTQHNSPNSPVRPSRAY